MIDYINYRWQQDILGYDSDDQDSLMRRLLGGVGLLKQLGMMVGMLALLAMGCCSGCCMANAGMSTR
jgi:hypothetical protein